MLDIKEHLSSVNDKFKRYQSLIDGVGFRKLNHLIVSGDPGIGKSFEAIEMLSGHAKTKRVRVCKSSGHMTPLAMYNHLYHYRNATDINLFDDCDAVFEVRHTLNLLKAATDTIQYRDLTWESTSKLVVAPSFRFSGSVILLTNIDMQADGVFKKYQALLDRVHYFRLDLTPEEKVARIVSVLFKKGKGQPIYCDDVCDWIMKNYQRFGRMLSIRTAVKLLELASGNKYWKAIAEMTVLPKDEADTEEL